MSWFVIRTATRREQRAMASLIEAEFTCYLPTETLWRQTPRIKSKVNRPLFPGYLFVRCEPWDVCEIVDLEGVHQFVRYARPDGELEAMPIPDMVVLGIQTDQRAGRFDTTRPTRRERDRIERKARAMKPGASVRVTAGPWADWVGKVIEARASDRAALIDFGGAIRGVEIPAEQLDAA